MKKQSPLLVSLVAALGILISACSATPERESTGEFLDSSMITARVKTRLIDDRITGGFHISVYTFKGVVRLSGTVNSEHEKNHAARLAAEVPGVKEVDNRLVVQVE